MRKAIDWMMIGVFGMLTANVGFAAWPLSEDAEPTLAPLLSETTPAVVSVSVVSAPEPASAVQDPFFQRFFEMPDQLPPQQGSGSGVIVDADRGLILTNHHVVRNADEIVVVLSDRRRFTAELIGGDAGTDIAVLRIDAGGLTALPFADSDELMVGDHVVAIGNPFGLEQTATTGIVSALGRTGFNVEGYEDFIQTDASINPGNSGGALIDINGRLVGINTVIISNTGTNVGVGFAVPSNMARLVMNRIIEYGEVRRGRLGIVIQDVTPDLANALSLDVDEGAIVADIDAGSAAETAGLMTGDVIVAVDDKAIADASDLRNEIGFVLPGEWLSLGIIRGDQRLTITAEVDLADQTAARSPEPENVSPLTGAEVQNLQPSNPYYGEVEGVVVPGIEPASRPARSGLRPGDIILVVNRRPVPTVAQLSAVLAEALPAVALTILRDGRRLFLVIR